MPTVQGLGLLNLLPFLRRFARALTGSQGAGDAYVEAALEALVTAKLARMPARIDLYRSVLDQVNGAQRFPESLPGTTAGNAEPFERHLAILTPKGRQAFLLDALWTCLAEGGLLLYATCSVFSGENEEQMAAFRARHPEALRETLTLPTEVARRGGQLLPSLPGACHNQDGFFYAMLRKP